MKWACLVAVAVLESACGQKKAAPPSAAPAPAATAAAAAKVRDQPGAAPGADWTYTSVGKRDPFRSFLAEVDQTTGIASRCATPLGRFDLEQLKLVAVVTGLDDPMAMVEAPNGIGYRLRRGECVGRNGGVVSTVRTGEVVVSEWVVRADGTREKAQTLLRLPRQASLNVEE